MDATKLIFGLLSFTFSAVAYYPYFKKIKSGHAHPTISTWICWLIMDSALLAGMIAKGEIAYQLGAYVLGATSVLIACVQVKAPLGWWWLDTVCMVLVGTAMFGWFKTGDPDIAIVVSVAAFIIGCCPMLINLYLKPEREPLTPWIVSWVGAMCGVAAIRKWNPIDSLTPLAFFILGLAVILLILRKFSPSRNKLASQILTGD